MPQAIAVDKDGNEVPLDLDVQFVIICAKHGSAIGPYDDLKAAAKDIKRVRTALEAQGEEPCIFEVCTMLPPLDEGFGLEKPTYEPTGYL